MLAREMFVKEFAYNEWVNGRVLAQADLVSEDEWRARADAEGRSLQEILAHLFSIERVWRLLSAHGEIAPEEMIGADQLQTVAAMRDLSSSESELMNILLQDWSDEAFAHEVIITRRDGSQFSLVRWHMLRHLLTHSMQHRSEAALLLTSYGRSPGDIDFLYFL